MHFESSVGQQLVTKQAQWQRHDNVKLRTSEILALGHFITPSPLSSRLGGAMKVNVIAAWDSPMWSMQCMWGL